jgi:YD repeat-containing protein
MQRPADDMAIFGTISTGACSLGTQGSGAGDHGPDRIVRTLYDAAGRTAQLRVAVGTADEAAEATFAYRPNGQVEFLVDGKGNRTQNVYDGHDRLERTLYPSATGPASFDDSSPANALASAGAVNSGDYEQPGYDAAGNVTSFRNRAGETTGFTYDALNRLITKNRPGSELKFRGHNT